MATTAPTAATGPKAQQFLEIFEREHETTMRVLRAYPTDKLDLKPHDMCKDARELAFMFAREQALAEKALTQGLDWSNRTPMPPAPDSWEDILGAVEEGHRRVADIVREMKDAQFSQTVKFPVAPKTIGDWPIGRFLWMLLFDQIHHRGQFSIYLRMAGAKVPSIYGPTADEPWM